MTNYYVDFTLGNDGNPGTEGSPWKTLNKVNLMTDVGAIISFKCGEIWYGDNYAPVRTYLDPKSGVTYNADYGSGNKPKIYIANSTAIGGWSGPVDGVYSVAYTPAAQAVFEDDHNLGPAASDATCGDGHWFWASDVLYYRPTGGSPGTVRAATITKIAVGSSGARSDIAISDLEIFGGYLSYDNGGGTLSNWTIDSVDFKEGGYAKFDFGQGGGVGDGIIIKNSTFNYAGAQSITVLGQAALALTNLTIQDNRIFYNNQTYFGATAFSDGRFDPGTSDNDAIYLQDISGLIIQDNELAYGNSDGYALIHHFIATGVSSTGNIWRRNFLHDTPGCGMVISGNAGTRHIDIYDNIISDYGTYLTSLFSSCGIGVTQAQQSANPSTIYNNTLYNGNIGIVMGSGPDYWLVKNNISKTQASQHIYIEPGEGGHNQIDYNCYDPDGAAMFYNNGSTYNFAGWKAATVFDDNSVQQDPLLVNAGGSNDVDFKLQSGSPCINAGVDVGLTTDYGGRGIVGVPDIGAWEYGSFADYSKGYRASLPGDDADLTLYTSDEYTYVNTDDDTTFATQAGPPSGYVIHEFKNIINGDTYVVRWDGKSNYSCTTNPVVLQVYDRITGGGQWEQVDIDNATAAGTEFVLADTKTGLTNYKDADDVVSFRVYQYTA